MCFHEESPARLGENVRIMSGAHGPLGRGDTPLLVTPVAQVRGNWEVLACEEGR